MNPVLNNKRPLTNYQSHDMAVFLFLKDNVKPEMYNIKQNEECHTGGLTLQ
jgi:hypothetical protein